MRIARVAAVLIAGAVVGAGCGGGSEDSGSAPSQDATATAAATKAAAAKPKSGPQAVEIKDFEFGPKQLTVAAGTKVTWTNEDTANHNVDFSSGSPKGIENLRQGQKGSVTFTKPGTYAYVCDFHANMKATVTVK